jgi:hypothetical protein
MSALSAAFAKHTLPPRQVMLPGFTVYVIATLSPTLKMQLLQFKDRGNRAAHAVLLRYQTRHESDEYQKCSKRVRSIAHKSREFIAPCDHIATLSPIRRHAARAILDNGASGLTKGKICIIAGMPVNHAVDVFHMSGSKVRGSS